MRKWEITGNMPTGCKGTRQQIKLPQALGAYKWSVWNEGKWKRAKVECNQCIAFQNINYAGSNAGYWRGALGGNIPRTIRYSK